MKKIKGRSVQSGLAQGTLRWLRGGQEPNISGSESAGDPPEAEREKLLSAVRRAGERQRALSEEVRERLGESSAALFAAHALMIEDPLLWADLEAELTRQGSARRAVALAMTRQRERFRSLDDPLMNARMADIDDIERELLDSLDSAEPLPDFGAEPVILAAEDLLPSTLIHMERSHLAGIVLRRGSAISHTAVLARSLGIPTLIDAVDIRPSMEGEAVLLNADEEEMVLSPTPEEQASFARRLLEEAEEERALERWVSAPDETKDGRKLPIRANISGPEELRMVRRFGADGVGLLRTEFLFLGRAQEPGEQEQYEAYRQVAEDLKPQQLVIRSFDFGGDKIPDYMQGERIGSARAIRLGLLYPDRLMRQLKAVLRASVSGNVSLLFPMIASIEELRQCLHLMDRCRQILRSEGRAFGEPRIGVMVETPAAVILADELAKYCDFFAIGTNDLTQYTCAIDRSDSAVSTFYDPRHPAVLRQIETTVQAAHTAGIPVCVCGELAGDSAMLPFFLGAGVDELSVSPRRVLPLRAALSGLEAGGGHAL